MSQAEDAARRIRQEFELGETVDDYDLEAVCAALGLEVRADAKLEGELTERYRPGRVSIRRGLRDNLVRWLTAHGLGHQVLHQGSRWQDDQVVARQEREAEEFAGWLFMERNWALHQPWELAEMHDLPQWRVERWLGIRSGQVAVSDTWRA